MCYLLPKPTWQVSCPSCAQAENRRFTSEETESKRLWAQGHRDAEVGQSLDCTQGDQAITYILTWPRGVGSQAPTSQTAQASCFWSNQPFQGKGTQESLNVHIITRGGSTADTHRHVWCFQFAFSNFIHK